MTFEDREHAGRRLAARLSALGPLPDLLVLALPRGGVPVAAPIAVALDAELDVLLVRKLGVPGHPELAMGAIALGGARVLNEDVLEMLKISPAEVERVTEAEELVLLDRARRYRDSIEAPRVRDRPIVVVDDGIATGATMRVAVEALRHAGAAKVVVAVPVAPASAIRALEEVADAVVCELMPEPFFAVGIWYRDFRQVQDDEVRALLRRTERLTGRGALALAAR